MSLGFNVKIRRRAILLFLNKTHGVATVILKGVSSGKHPYGDSHGSNRNATKDANKDYKPLTHALFCGGGTGLIGRVIWGS